MIPVCEPELGAAELENVVDAVESGFVSGTTGEYLEAFEDGFARYCGCDHGVATTSGTTALHLALESLGIGEGDEVIVPDLTNAATAFSVVYANATPVAVDCDPETWCMDVEQVEALVTDRTEAIIPVHLYGHPVDMDPLLDIAEEHDLAVVEDAAEAHGAEYRGSKAGGIGDVGCFSFYANKIITTGEGGMVVTDDPDVAERARLLRNLAFHPERRFRHDHIGYNYRMTNVQAAIGLGQLEKIDRFVDRKREMADQYSERLGDVEGLVLPVERDWAKNVYWMYGVLVDPAAPLSRDELRAALADRGIDTRTFFLPMSDQRAFLDRGLLEATDNPVARELGERGLYLPSGVGLSDDEIDTVAAEVADLME